MVLTFCLSLSLPWLSSAADMITTLRSRTSNDYRDVNRTVDNVEQELTEQTIELNQLRQKLKMLRSTSGEQIKLLESLQNDLSKTQENLMSANVSLTACRNELKESRASLQTLKNQIKNLKHKQEVTRRQRDTWAALCGLVLVASVR